MGEAEKIELAKKVFQLWQGGAINAVGFAAFFRVLFEIPSIEDWHRKVFENIRAALAEGKQ